MSIVSRRSFVGAVVVAVAAGVGVTAEFVRHPAHTSRQTGSRSRSRSRSTSPSPPPVPPLLAEALARERALLVRLDDAARATPTLRARLSVLQADHQAHVDALSALITASGAMPPSTTPTSATPSSTTSSATDPPESGSSNSGSSASADPGASAPGLSITATEVVALEKANVIAAARDCPTATGSAAAVLASIYACEQTHVAWLG